MKRIILIALIPIIACGCFVNAIHKYGTHASDQLFTPAEFLNSIIILAQKNSLYANDVDWNELRKEMTIKFIDNGSISSLKEPLIHMMTRLGDYHGSIIVNNEVYKGIIKRNRNVPYDYESRDYFKAMSAIYQKSLNEFNIRPSILDDSIAYIQIPLIHNNTGNENINIDCTQIIRNEICDLHKNNPKGYIIDLRGNIGGNFFPMLSGLGELIPNMELGGDTKDGRTFHAKWRLINGSLYNNDYSIPNMPAPKCHINIGNRKIAVLIGRYTASSGEAVASSLKGQKNIMLFGEQTAGASTTNAWVPISENVFCNLTVAYYMSVDKTVHKDGIIPDYEIIEDYNPDNPTCGETVRRAIDWINYNDNIISILMKS